MNWVHGMCPEIPMQKSRSELSSVPKIAFIFVLQHLSSVLWILPHDKVSMSYVFRAFNKELATCPHTLSSNFQVSQISNETFQFRPSNSQTFQINNVHWKLSSHTPMF